MKFTKILLAASVLVGLANLANAQSRHDRFVEVTSRITSLSTNQAFPTATGVVSFEVQCGDRFDRVEQTVNHSRRRKVRVHVRVVLVKNTMIRCIWANPRVLTEKFEINVEVPHKLIAVQPGGELPPPPELPEVLELDGRVSKALLDDRVHEIMARVKMQRRRGTIGIDRIESAQRRMDGEVRIYLNRVTSQGRMRRRVTPAGHIRVQMAMPPGAITWQVIDANLVPERGPGPRPVPRPRPPRRPGRR